jgi:putative membrane protein
MRDLTYFEKNEQKKHIVLLVVIVLWIIWSGIGAVDYFAWVSLTLPSFFLILGLAIAYPKFKYSTFTYFMVFLHIVVLLYGARYRYSGMPLFVWITETFDLHRNYYDRVGHFMQGFAPMFMSKEYFFRSGILKRCKMSYLILMSFILGISAFWELSEFAAAMITKKPASYIFSSQGILWDTQWDMVLAIIGGATALFVFGKLHDKKMNEMTEKKV